MKLIKMKNGYVNADMIESFAVIEYEKHCDIIGYTPSYSDDCGRYYLGYTNEEYEAYQRLNILAKWLTETKNGIFDIMVGGDNHAAEDGDTDD